MGFTVDLEVGRRSCAESIIAFRRAIDELSEHDLLGRSRCHGWTRLDVMVHVIAGWQELQCGMLSVVAAAPSVDAASYWTAFAAEYGDADPVADLMSQRRRTSSYLRPASARDHAHEVADALLCGIDRMPDQPCRWQGHVFTAGDFLAVWAVENVVHQLDLWTDVPAPPAALSLTRATIEGLVGVTLPAAVSDEDAALIGAGRIPVPPELTELAPHLPALG